MVILLGSVKEEDSLCHSLGIFDPANPLLLRKSCIFRQPRSSLKNIVERFVAVVRSKNASPTWSDVRTALLDFDRAGLRGLVLDLSILRAKTTKHSCMPTWA
jgi:hypothetical protein